VTGGLPRLTSPTSCGQLLSDELRTT